MTLATKNGSLVVKDGKLAENCECCEGDNWYCCPSRDCIGYSINSATVTISATDYLKQTTRSYLYYQPPSLNPIGTRYEHTSVGFLGAAFAGSHSLSRQQDGSWRKDFASQGGGSCVASLLLTFQSATGWTLVFSYGILSYVVDSLSSTPDHKELSEMTCGADGAATVTLTGGFGERVDGSLQVTIVPCSFSSYVWTASHFKKNVTTSLDARNATEFQPAWTASGTVVREVGTNTATIAISFA